MRRPCPARIPPRFDRHSAPRSACRWPDRCRSRHIHFHEDAGIAEDLVRIFLIEADTVIADTDDPLRILALTRDVDADRLVTAVFDGVTDEILKYLDERRLMCEHGWQRIGGNDCAALRNGGA